MSDVADVRAVWLENLGQERKKWVNRHVSDVLQHYLHVGTLCNTRGRVQVHTWRTASSRTPYHFVSSAWLRYPLLLRVGSGLPDQTTQEHTSNTTNHNPTRKWGLKGSILRHGLAWAERLASGLFHIFTLVPLSRLFGWYPAASPSALLDSEFPRATWSRPQAKPPPIMIPQSLNQRNSNRANGESQGDSQYGVPQMALI
jgi:hypothetical protein